MNDSAERFALIEIDEPEPAPKATVIESVDNLYRGAFQGHATLEDAIQAVPELAGLVSKEPLYTADGLQVPRAYATIRTLPSGQKQALGTVGERYCVVQDSAALEILRPLVDQGLIGTLTAGVYRAKSWLYGEAGAYRADIAPGDTIEARVLVGNSHDGSIPWSFGFPGNRVVCQNTFHMALSSNLSKLLKVRHTRSAEEIVAQVTEAVARFGFEFVDSADKFRYLAKVKCNEDSLKEYTSYVFRPSKWAESDEEESSRDRVYVQVLENFKGGRGASPGNWWGAYNAVTEYLSHQRARESTSAAAQFVDLQWGNGAGLARRAYDGAMQMGGAA